MARTRNQRRRARRDAVTELMADAKRLGRTLGKSERTRVIRGRRYAKRRSRFIL